MLHSGLNQCSIYLIDCGYQLSNTEVLSAWNVAELLALPTVKCIAVRIGGIQLFGVYYMLLDVELVKG